jgi:hypothetical protein
VTKCTCSIAGAELSHSLCQVVGHPKPSLFGTREYDPADIEVATSGPCGGRKKCEVTGVGQSIARNVRVDASPLGRGAKG